MCVSPCFPAMLLRLSSSGHFSQHLEGLGRKTIGAGIGSLLEGGKA